MASSYRPNRYMAPSLGGQRAVDAEEERMREQILRENAKAAATKAAAARINITKQAGDQATQNKTAK